MADTKPRILIIDDNKVTVAGLKAYLGKKYHILTSHHGMGGMQKFEKNEDRIHLVLTDLVFQDASGSYLVSWIKEKAPEKPVIAMTGWEYSPEELEPQTNADLILKKPFEMEELDRALEKLLPEMPPKKLGEARPKKNAGSDIHTVRLTSV
jgi:DNA-binding response OmpR family regulator